MKTIKYLFISLIALLLFNACGEDYLDTENRYTLEPEAIGEAGARNPDAFLNGIWSWLIDFAVDADDCNNFMAVLHSKDMMSEDISISAFHWFGYDYDFDFRNEDWRRTRCDWSTFYTTISKSNEIISLFPNGPKTNAEKSFMGQALAMRGFSYYYLIQIYQDYMNDDGSIKRDAPGVPLMYTVSDGMSPDEIEAKKGRNTVGEVLDQAEKDLTAAVDMLKESDYKRSNDANGKEYVDAQVASGLLARLYLLTQQYEKAADAAREARKGYVQRNKEELHDGFMDVTTCDVMWGFNHTSETSAIYAHFFSYMSALSPGYAGLKYSTKLIDAKLYSQIPDNDYRKDLFNGPEGNQTQEQKGAQLPWATLKFGWDGSWTMDYIYMRAAEMVLIEAEADARLGKTAEAATVLKELMSKRVPGWNESSVSVEDIMLQRRIELWGEGFSYFDLKRQNLGINRNYSGTNHFEGYRHVIPAHDVRWTYQIPQTEIQENDLISAKDQNP